MITPVQDNNSGISQLFFEKSFPEPKEEPLFTIKKKKSGSSDAAEGARAAGEVMVDRATFAAFLQAEMGGSRTGETGGVKQENSGAADRAEVPVQERFRRDSSSAVSSDILKMKIRMQQGGEMDALLV